MAFSGGSSGSAGRSQNPAIHSQTLRMSVGAGATGGSRTGLPRRSTASALWKIGVPSAPKMRTWAIESRRTVEMTSVMPERSKTVTAGGGAPAGAAVSVPPSIGRSVK